MSLAIGTKLGPYEILAPIGAGGMGEVWKARDTRLDRVVAIKVSHDRFSERFTREAMAVAALNHRNICALYDVGPDYLVFEYIDGRPLKGPLPLNLSLQYAVQICDALDTAHKAGIVHRDLKPPNILLTKSGVKLLDFGLAKLSRAREVAAGATTETIALTKDHTMLGTLQYMSPEQLECKDVDARSDIFSFGAVLYEMVTGKRAFEGASQASVVAAILERDPPPLSSLEPVAPPALERVVSKCMAKDPDERWQSAKDLKDELEWIAGGTAEAGEPVQSSPRNLIPWAIAGVLALILVVLALAYWRATRPVEHPLVRLSVDLGPDAVTGISTTVAISPDGRRLVYPAQGPDGRQQLATRLLEEVQAALLPGTAGGRDAFFSPDGRWVGFFADNKLKKVSVQGGAPITLCDAPIPRGASWGDDGNIVAALGSLDPLRRLPAGGGVPQVLTRFARGAITHRWPQVLPGSQAVLFTSALSTMGMDDADIEVLALKTGVTKVLQRGGYYGRYLPGGHLVYVHQGALFGVEFDADKLEVRGTPVPLVEEVAVDPVLGGGQLDFSGTGTLVYMAGKEAIQTWPIAWLDSSGKTQPLLAAPGAYYYPRVSPDGQKLAFAKTAKGQDIFVYDFERQVTTRLTFDERSTAQVWSPDGRHIAFRSAVGGFRIWWVRSDGAGEPQRLLEGQNNLFPSSFSPDGRRLAYGEANPQTGYDIWTVPLDTSDPDHPKPGKPEPFLTTPAAELGAIFSPDGHWIAYGSNESGTNEIYVRPFPGPGGKWQISTGGGSSAFWAKKRDELFYVAKDRRIMVLDFTAKGDSFQPGTPRVWSNRHIIYTGTGAGVLDIAPDGKRFAVLAPEENAGPAKGSVRVTFLENFFDELRRRIPPGGR
jgi:serine/threonine-protein kinase